MPFKSVSELKTSDTRSRGGAWLGTLEACWLVALVVVPLAYDPHNQNGFTAIKIPLLRAIGIVAIVALIMEGITSRWNVREVFFREWSWILPLGGLLLVGGISTLFSLDPWASLYGSPEFLEGIFTWVAASGILCAVVVGLKRWEQAERLACVAVLGSVPMALYAMIQRAGLDPMAFAGTMVGDKMVAPVTAFAGQAIFVGGYLVMLVPVSLWLAYTAWKNTEHPKWQRVLGAALGCTVCLLQIGGILACEKRGPFLALGAVLFSACLLVAVRRALPRLAVGALAGIIVLVAGLFLLAHLTQGGTRLGETPVLKSLARIAPSSAGASDGFRDAVWRASAQIVFSGETFTFPSGEKDRWVALRPWLGYGLETTPALLSPRWMNISGGPDGRIESRLHNVLWDRLQTVGALGLLFTLWLMLIVWQRGVQAMGAVSTRRSLLCAGGGSVIGAAVGYSLSGVGFLALGLGFGLVGGLLIGVLWECWQDGKNSPRPLVSSAEALALALIAALIGHAVDMSFVFPTPATLLVFSIFSGAVIALSRMPHRVDESPAAPVQMSLLRGSILCGLLGLFLAYAFCFYLSTRTFEWSTVLASAFTHVQSANTNPNPTSFILPLLFFPTLAVGALILVGCGEPSRRYRFALDWTMLFAAGVAGTALASLTIAVWLASVGPIPSPQISETEALAYGARYMVLPAGLLILTLLSLGTLAWTLSGPVRLSAKAMATGLALLAGSSLLIMTFVAEPLWHTAYRGRAEVLQSVGSKPPAAILFAEALAVNPWNITTRLQHGVILMEMAMEASTKSDYLEHLQNAAKTLENGRKYRPFHYLDYYLGRTYLLLALQAPDKSAHQDLLKKAHEAFIRSLRLTALNDLAWVDLAIVQQLQGDPDGAAKSLQESDKVSGTFDPAPWGKFYTAQSFANPDQAISHGYARRALKFLDQNLETLAASASPETEDEIYRLWVTKATLHRNLGEPILALVSLQMALKLNPPGGTWQANAMLGHVYMDLGNPKDAATEVRKALSSAPEEAKDSLFELLQAISRKVDN